MTCQICTTPVTVSPNRMLACSAATTWVTIRILRLSTRSASTPPSGARIMAGRNCSASTVPSCSGVPPSSRTSHGWLTDCIQVPMRLTICPVQKRRKFRCRSAAMPRRKAEEGAGTADSSGSASSAPTSLRRGGRLPSGRRVSSGPDIVSNANKWASAPPPADRPEGGAGLPVWATIGPTDDDQADTARRRLVTGPGGGPAAQPRTDAAHHGARGRGALRAAAARHRPAADPSKAPPRVTGDPIDRLPRVVALPPGGDTGSGTARPQELIPLKARQAAALQAATHRARVAFGLDALAIGVSADGTAAGPAPADGRATGSRDWTAARRSRSPASPRPSPRR